MPQHIPEHYLGRPYYALDSYLKSRFGQKVYKLSLDGGMTCPNRDGRIGAGGCSFCSAGGSGDFAQGRIPSGDVWEQIELAKGQVAKKSKGPYIAYFQSYTNTYAPVEYLEKLFMGAISHPDILGLSVGTRPDCLEQEKVELLGRLNKIKPVWVELGLQTMHERTAKNIRRGYDLSCFEDAHRRLAGAGLLEVVHLILGLPGETREDMLETVRYVAGLNPMPHGVKLSMLHVLKGTDMALEYENNPFYVFSMDAYVDFVISCIEQLPPDLVVHRITGDGPKSLLVAPLWSANKREVMNAFARGFRERDTWQGKNFTRC